MPAMMSLNDRRRNPEVAERRAMQEARDPPVGSSPACDALVGRPRERARRLAARLPAAAFARACRRRAAGRPQAQRRRRTAQRRGMRSGCQLEPRGPARDRCTGDRHAVATPSRAAGGATGGVQRAHAHRRARMSRRRAPAGRSVPDVTASARRRCRRRSRWPTAPRRAAAWRAPRPFPGPPPDAPSAPGDRIGAMRREQGPRTFRRAGTRAPRARGGGRPAPRRRRAWRRSR